jgi:hypothetical protein
MLQGSGKDSFILSKKFLDLPLNLRLKSSRKISLSHDFSRLGTFSLLVDSFKTTLQCPLSACRILIFLLSFRDVNAIDSFLVMLDVKGLIFPTYI